MAEDLTETQCNVYNFMVDFFEEYDQLPTRAAIAAEFKWSSPNAAHEVVKRLEAKSWLSRNILGNIMFAR